MEEWQRQGFASLGDWRRATEKARRLSKKQGVPVACAAIAARVAATAASAVTWQPSLELPQPSASDEGESEDDFLWQPGELPEELRLTGGVHEHVQVTPRGSRAHKFKHTSQL